jgi:hypothetical protein
MSLTKEDLVKTRVINSIIRLINSDISNAFTDVIDGINIAIDYRSGKRDSYRINKEKKLEWIKE